MSCAELEWAATYPCRAASCTHSSSAPKLRKRRGQQKIFEARKKKSLAIARALVFEAMFFRIRHAPVEVIESTRLLDHLTAVVSNAPPDPLPRRIRVIVP